MGYYYGILGDEKPKKGLEFMLFEEAMEKSFQEKMMNLERSFEDLRKKHNSEIIKLTEETKKLHTRYQWIAKLFDKDKIEDKAIDYKKSINKADGDIKSKV